MRAVGGCVDWPALPVDGPVVEIRDLWWQIRIDIQGVEIQTKAQVAEYRDAICAAYSCQEWIRWVGASVGVPII